MLGKQYPTYFFKFPLKFLNNIFNLFIIILFFSFLSFNFSVFVTTLINYSMMHPCISTREWVRPSVRSLVHWSLTHYFTLAKMRKNGCKSISISLQSFPLTLSLSFCLSISPLSFPSNLSLETPIFNLCKMSNVSACGFVSK